jgi:phosphoribosylformylglycinamidine synthase
MYEACEAMSDLMLAIGLSVDGGKDSLSMAARVKGETVKAPGALVVTVYSPCPDITQTLTPDLKAADSLLLLVDVADGMRRLGGSALAQVYSQLGDTTPDVEKPQLLAGAFEVVQTLMRKRMLRGAHDVSDGGLLVAALEMAFAGDLGLELALPAAEDAFGALFAEEVALLLEVAPESEAAVLGAFADKGVPCARVGSAKASKEVSVAVGGKSVLADSMVALRDVWEATGFELEKLQAAPACVAQEQAALKTRHAPKWSLSYAPSAPVKTLRDGAPAVAILRQEGSNGDREMAAAVFAAGLQPWDVAMTDLLGGNIGLERFRGIFFVGGFSYADTLDSAKGWAGSIRFNPRLKAQFDAFRARSDTFSLGVCNGCQLMALLGWVPGGGDEMTELPQTEQPRFVHNKVFFLSLTPCLPHATPHSSYVSPSLFFSTECTLREPLVRGHRAPIARASPQGYGGIDDGCVGRTWRGARALPARACLRARALEEPRAPTLRGRRARDHRGVPAQSERRAAGHRSALL